MTALFLLRSAHEKLAREGLDVTQGTSRGRILVFLGYSGTPVVFGIISYVMARPALDASDAIANASVVRLEPLLLWATFAFSVASCSTIAAQAGIVRSRLWAFLGSGFGRVLPLSVVPTTAVVFALVQWEDRSFPRSARRPIGPERASNAGSIPAPRTSHLSARRGDDGRDRRCGRRRRGALQFLHDSCDCETGGCTHPARDEDREGEKGDEEGIHRKSTKDQIDDVKQDRPSAPRQCRCDESESPGLEAEECEIHHGRKEKNWGREGELAHNHQGTQARVHRCRKGRETSATSGEHREDEHGGGRKGDAGRVRDRVPQDLTVERGREIHRPEEDLETEEEQARADPDGHEPQARSRPVPSGPLQHDRDEEPERAQDSARDRHHVRRAPEGLRDEALGHQAVPRFVPRERERLEERAGPDEQEFDWHEEADDMDTGTGPTGRARPGNGSDDSREGDVAESRVEDEMRRW